MAAIAKNRIKKEQKDELKLKEIKRSVETAREYFADNYKRYHQYMNFVFNTSLTDDDLATLDRLKKPKIQFNVLEAYISRLRGEFAKNQPSPKVCVSDGVPEVISKSLAETSKLIETHLQAQFFDGTNDSFEYQIYSDLLGGGFSVAEVYTDYTSEMSMDQSIFVGRVFDPTMCGFDPMARESHKGDGRYCFQLYPRSKKEFEDEYGKKVTQKMRFTKMESGFGWSYADEREKIVLICDFYEKKKKKRKLYKLADKTTMFQEDYEDLLAEWEERGYIEQPPAVVAQRWTYEEIIVRHRFCETELLETVETDFKQFPLVFFDGNSVMLTQGDSQWQMTRPYIWHAKDAQRMRNFVGQSLANEIENMVQHKWVAALEAIPPEYIDAYKNPQSASTIIYRHANPENPAELYPPPREVMRPPIPPELLQTFAATDQMTQSILGTYDAALGINDNELSGTAIAMGATQSNAAAMPYMMGFVRGMNRVCQIYVDLLPKYYKTPRTLPIIDGNGKRQYVPINQDNSQTFNYDNSSYLNVKVEIGASFAIQKEQALKTVTLLMQASPAFGNLMNAVGLPFLLDNLNIKGADQLKELAVEFQQQQAQQQQAQAQQQQQYAEQQLQMSMQHQQAQIQRESALAQKDMMQAQKIAMEAQAPSKESIDMAKLQQESYFKQIEAQQNQQKIDIDLASLQANLEQMGLDEMARLAELDSERARQALDAIKTLAGMQNKNRNM